GSGTAPVDKVTFTGVVRGLVNSVVVDVQYDGFNAQGWSPGITKQTGGTLTVNGPQVFIVDNPTQWVPATPPTFPLTEVPNSGGYTQTLVAGFITNGTTTANGTGTFTAAAKFTWDASSLYNLS